MSARARGTSIKVHTTTNDDEDDSPTSSSENESFSDTSEYSESSSDDEDNEKIASQFQPLEGSEPAIESLDIDIERASSSSSDTDSDPDDEISQSQVRVSRALARARVTLLGALSFGLAIWAQHRGEEFSFDSGNHEMKRTAVATSGITTGAEYRCWAGLLKALKDVERFLGDRKVLMSPGVTPCLSQSHFADWGCPLICVLVRN